MTITVRTTRSATTELSPAAARAIANLEAVRDEVHGLIAYHLHAGDQRGAQVYRDELDRINQAIANERRPDELARDIDRVLGELHWAETWHPATVPTLERTLDGLRAEREYWLRRLGRNLDGEAA